MYIYMNTYLHTVAKRIRLNAGEHATIVQLVLVNREHWSSTRQQSSYKRNVRNQITMFAGLAHVNVFSNLAMVRAIGLVARTG